MALAPVDFPRSALASKPLAASGVSTLIGVDGGEIVRSFGSIANIKDFGAQGGYVPATDSHPNDDTIPVFAALTASNVIYVPEGDYYVSDVSTHRLLEKTTQIGPGRIWVPYFGVTRKTGQQIKVGNAATDLGNSLPGGLVLGGQGYSSGGESEGMRFWASHPSWVQMQPTAGGFPSQFQLYSNSLLGTATGGVGTDVLTAAVGAFSLIPTWAGGVDLVEVGDEIGWGDTLYHIKERTSSSSIKLETTSGGAVSIVDGSEAVFRHVYEYSYGTCDVSGVTVTWKSGILFNQGNSIAGQKFLFLNGTRYNISSVDSARQITLTASAGTLANAAFIQKDMDGHRSSTIHRIQGLAGSKEENWSLNIDAQGRALIDLQGTLRATPLLVRGDPAWDGSGNEDHFYIWRDGRISLNAPPVTNYQFFQHAQTATAMSDGSTRLKMHVFRGKFGTDQRLMVLGMANNFQGGFIQSYLNNGSTGVQTEINPDGGAVAIGTMADIAALGFVLGVAGDIGPDGDGSRHLGSATKRYADVYSATFRPGAGAVFWTSGSGTPEGAVTAPVGSLYTRTNGGAGTTLYVKESGSGNTGWVAK